MELSPLPSVEASRSLLASRNVRGNLHPESWGEWPTHVGGTLFGPDRFEEPGTRRLEEETLLKRDLNIGDAAAVKDALEMSSSSLGILVGETHRFCTYPTSDWTKVLTVGEADDIDCCPHQRHGIQVNEDRCAHFAAYCCDVVVENWSELLPLQISLPWSPHRPEVQPRS